MQQLSISPKKLNKKGNAAAKKAAKHPALQQVLNMIAQAEDNSDDSKKVAHMLTLDILPSNMTVECAMDQKITRFIQQRLEVIEVATESKEVDRFFQNLLLRHGDTVESQQGIFCRLIKDVYANYVLQKLFLRLDEHQKEIVFKNIVPLLTDFVTHKHACRVVQEALDVFSSEQMITIYSIVLYSANKDGVPNLRFLSFNFYGNHVI